MIRLIALVSGIYDVTVGVTLMFFREAIQSWFGVLAPQPPIHADLNAIFVMVIGIGYAAPLVHPERYRAYLWLFGVVLKGAGAIAFIVDFVSRDSPVSYLLFAACDGALAVATLLILLSWPTGKSEVQSQKSEKPSDL